MADVLGIAGLVVSLAGWGTAIYQIMHVRRTTEAVSSALAAERARSAGVQLVMAAASLDHGERELLRAIGAQDRDAAIEAVREWRTTAIRVQQLTDAAGVEVPDELATALSTALALVDICISELADDEIALVEASRRLLKRVSQACRLTGALATTMTIGNAPQSER